MNKVKRIKKWRELEQLVEKIEAQLGPIGATVKSPDHIPDIITNKLREVDISIRYFVGSTPFLMIVECRDRNRKADVTWIEQVKTKRDDVHADIAIAVSKKGFAPEALDKAYHYNIRTRTLSEIKEDEIKDWVKNIEITMLKEMYEIEDIFLTVPREEEDKLKKINSDTQEHPIDIQTKFIKRIADGEVLSIENLIFEYQKSKGMEFDDSKITIPNMKIEFKESFHGEIFSKRRYPALHESISLTSEKQEKKLKFTFKKGEFNFKSESEEVEAIELDVKFNVWIENFKSDIKSVSNYKNGNDLIASIGESEFVTGTIGKIKFTVVKNYSEVKK
jgi:hypothetical protein